MYNIYIYIYIYIHTHTHTNIQTHFYTICYPRSFSRRFRTRLTKRSLHNEAYKTKLTQRGLHNEAYITKLTERSLQNEAQATRLIKRSPNNEAYKKKLTERVLQKEAYLNSFSESDAFKLRSTLQPSEKIRQAINTCIHTYHSMFVHECFRVQQQALRAHTDYKSYLIEEPSD